VFGSQVLHAEQVLFKTRDLLAAFPVAKRGRIGAAAVEQIGVRGDRLVGLPEFFGGLVIDPAAAKRNDLGGVKPHGHDVLSLRHLHDLANRRWPRDLFAHE
jgi:hypothetical protein